jgi:ABC-type transporter MlaC component
MINANVAAMSFLMKMRKLAKCLAMGIALIAADLGAHAQTGPATPVKPSAIIELSVKGEADAKSIPETEAKAGLSAQTLPSIDEFIAKLDSTSRAIHASSKNDATLIRDGCRRLLNEILDLDAMAQAANVEIWEKMTASQRDLFRLAFEHRMVGNCVRQFGTYGGESLELAGVRTADGGQLLATVRVGSQGDAKLVTWRLHNLGPHSWRAVDVIAEGRSAVSDARVEYEAVLQSVNGDIEALITFMQR